MKYISTRDTGIKMTSAEVIKKGLSDEGGLFVPDSIPKLTLKEIKSLVNLSYIDRAKYVLKKYLTDFTEEELSYCVEGAYGNNHFDSDEIAPVVKLNDGKYILELWHGPTCAFKDMALQILPRFMTTSAKKTGEDKEIVILVATSGDTGKAALEGFKDVDGTKISVFYPSDGVSDIQKLQMATQEGKNVCVAAIKGNFDDAQNGVKALFTDDAYKKKLFDKGFVFSSANSINWGRLVPQIVYYISAYCDMVKKAEIKLGDEINVCVPTGNFGNILAAYYAKKMGLPIKKLICASNKNNVLTDFIKTGEYNKNREFYQSVSPSMDILISSNLERLLFDICDEDSKKVASLMSKLVKTGKYKLTKAQHKKITDVFWGGYCDDYFTKVQIWKTFTQTGYTLDTHTAVAVDVYEQYVRETEDMTKTIIASTASPFKFNYSVLSAIGAKTDGLDDFELIESLEKISGMKTPKSLAELKNKKVRFKKVIDKDDMKKFVSDTLKIK